MFLRGAARFLLLRRAHLAGAGPPLHRIRSPRPGHGLRNRGCWCKHLHDVFPVVEGDRPLGLVGVEQVRKVPRDQWEATSVGQAMVAVSPELSVDAGEDATKALSQMQRDGRGKLLVTDGTRLVGILSRRIVTLL
jgi:CBS domain-containing protein